MTEEKITLVGGPRNGEVLGWRGGDTAEFPVFEPMMATAKFDARNVPVKYETALYVRSRRSRHIFVFQP